MGYGRRIASFFPEDPENFLNLRWITTNAHESTRIVEQMMESKDLRIHRRFGSGSAGAPIDL
jgi:hypothetical protein